MTPDLALTGRKALRASCSVSSSYRRYGQIRNLWRTHLTLLLSTEELPGERMLVHCERRTLS